MKAEIIAVGTELLLGQIVNTNAQFLSEQLNAQGISVYFHSVVGDNPDRLAAQLAIAHSRSDLVLLTGGLGSTKDDLTKEVVARHVGRSLKLEPQALKRIQRFFEARQMPMTENNKRQALIIDGARVFPNETGLAPGMAVKHEGVHYLLFPGPPGELKPMYFKYARPYLVELSPDQHVVHSKVMRFCGIGESALESRLLDLIDNQTNPTIAPLAKEGEVTLRLTSFAKSKADAEQKMASLIREIQARVGKYQYGWDEETLEEVLVRQLHHNNLTVAAAESCTGGLVCHSITRVNGASQVFPGGIVCYANDVKMGELGVPPEVLGQDGAISERTARILAEEVRKKFKTDLGVSVTGVAGPEQQERKPVGLVFIGVAGEHKTRVYKVNVGGSRHTVQTRAAKLALFYLIRTVEELVGNQSG
ncbi:competence/damage-inducible protein A [Caldalkalibacillus thermarum TA2.A1]|uniref:Putative competence-damage inducible protein n=1 Tax=Caldalkalibacillus thermarum (strain TA2.A1) TaxID=986075 RepID=A0A8X8L9C8_CALTT|nr:competence/damage-inducible protein A [Caldalkalibacillus thermarum]QZT32958.1 competence/damage-inducible protein A [Caldalkalibacillus thermarum TA2.A1]